MLWIHSPTLRRRRLRRRFRSRSAGWSACGARSRSPSRASSSSAPPPSAPRPAFASPTRPSPRKSWRRSGVSSHTATQRRPRAPAAAPASHRVRAGAWRPRHLHPRARPLVCRLQSTRRCLRRRRGSIWCERLFTPPAVNRCCSRRRPTRSRCSSWPSPRAASGGTMLPLQLLCNAWTPIGSAIKLCRERRDVEMVLVLGGR